jgi:hypothetical protein
MEDVIRDLLEYAYDYVNDKLECPFCDGDWFIAHDNIEMFGHAANCPVPRMEKFLAFYDPLKIRHCDYIDIIKYV